MLRTKAFLPSWAAMGGVMVHRAFVREMSGLRSHFLSEMMLEMARMESRESPENTPVHSFSPGTAACVAPCASGCVGTAGVRVGAASLLRSCRP